MWKIMKEQQDKMWSTLVERHCSVVLPHYSALERDRRVSSLPKKVSNPITLFTLILASSVTKVKLLTWKLASPNLCTQLTTGLKIKCFQNTGSSKKMDGILNRYNVKSTRRIYTFRILKCSESLKF